MRDDGLTQPGIWSVQEQNGRVYFMYRDHTIGQFSGSPHNARYMVTCINAALSAWAPIAAAIEAEGDA